MANVCEEVETFLKTLKHVTRIKKKEVETTIIDNRPKVIASGGQAGIEEAKYKGKLCAVKKVFETSGRRRPNTTVAV